MDEGRDRGILTKRDRKWLQENMDEQPSPGTSHYRVIQSAIRNRIKNSLIDFGFLWEYPDKTDYKTVFEPPMEDSVRKAIAVLYQGASQENWANDFWDLLRDGIRWAGYEQEELTKIDIERESGSFAEKITITIEKEPVDIDELWKKYEEDEASVEEITWLAQSTEVTLERKHD